MKCSGIIKAKTTQQELCGRAGTCIFVLPCKEESLAETRTLCYPDVSVGVCEGVRLDSMYYERTLPMNS